MPLGGNNNINPGTGNNHLPLMGGTTRQSSSLMERKDSSASVFIAQLEAEIGNNEDNIENVEEPKNANSSDNNQQGGNGSNGLGMGVDNEGNISVEVGNMVGRNTCEEMKDDQASMASNTPQPNNPAMLAPTPQQQQITPQQHPLFQAQHQAIPPHVSDSSRGLCHRSRGCLWRVPAPILSNTESSSSMQQNHRQQSSSSMQQQQSPASIQQQ